MSATIIATASSFTQEASATTPYLEAEKLNFKVQRLIGLNLVTKATVPPVRTHNMHSTTRMAQCIPSAQSLASRTHTLAR